MAPGIFLSAQWEYLTMFNYEVDEALLLPHLPPFTQLDLYNGKAVVSVVGFLFNDTKVLGVKWPGFVNFEEVNLRYYIKYFDGNNWKRGVGFISEIVPKRLIACMANLLYNEHYSTAEMEHLIELNEDELQVSYSWQKKSQRKNSMWVKAIPVPSNIIPDSEEEFIFEHYSGYNKLNDSRTIEYSLSHPVWQVYPVTGFGLDCDIAEAYGEEFSPFLHKVKPVSVFLARGSQVSVKMPRRLSK